jgi:hypothetical protein
MRLELDLVGLGAAADLFEFGETVAELGDTVADTLADGVIDSGALLIDSIFFFCFFHFHLSYYFYFFCFLWATQPPFLYHHHLPIHHSHP